VPVTRCHALLQPSFTPHVSRSHLHVKSSRCTYSSPYNQPIISGSTIHHSFPPSHPIVFKRGSFYSASQFYLDSKPHDPDPILGDLTTEVLQMSSNKFLPMFPTSYPEISAIRVLVQLEHYSLWLLLSVCTYPMYMTRLCCEISWMHRSLHIVFFDVLSGCQRAIVEIDHDATKNVIGMQYTTPWPWHVLKPWSLDHVIFHLSHLVILAFHIHIIISMQVSYEFLEPIA
jgi:hypothetical protein